MILCVSLSTRKILAFSDRAIWSVPPYPNSVLVETPGDPSTYAWPNGDAMRCLYTEAGAIIGDPAWVDKDDVRDAYVAAKAAIQALAASTGVPLVAREAVARLGLCVEELLKYLNKRIA